MAFAFTVCIIVQGMEEAFKKDDVEKAQNLVTTLKYVTNIQAAILEKL